MKFILVLTFLISTLTSFSQINLIKEVSIKNHLINKDVKLTESEIVEGLTDHYKRVFIFCKCIFLGGRI